MHVAAAGCRRRDVRADIYIVRRVAAVVGRVKDHVARTRRRHDLRDRDCTVERADVDRAIGRVRHRTGRGRRARQPGHDLTDRQPAARNRFPDEDAARRSVACRRGQRGDIRIDRRSARRGADVPARDQRQIVRRDQQRAERLCYVPAGSQFHLVRSQHVAIRRQHNIVVIAGAVHIDAHVVRRCGDRCRDLFVDGQRAVGQPQIDAGTARTRRRNAGHRDTVDRHRADRRAVGFRDKDVAVRDGRQRVVARIDQQPIRGRANIAAHSRRPQTECRDRQRRGTARAAVADSSSRRVEQQFRHPGIQQSDTGRQVDRRRGSGRRVRRDDLQFSDRRRDTKAVQLRIAQSRHVVLRTGAGIAQTDSCVGADRADLDRLCRRGVNRRAGRANCEVVERQGDLPVVRADRTAIVERETLVLVGAGKRHRARPRATAVSRDVLTDLQPGARAAPRSGRHRDRAGVRVQTRNRTDSRHDQPVSFRDEDAAADCRFGCDGPDIGFERVAERRNASLRRDTQRSRCDVVSRGVAINQGSVGYDCDSAARCRDGVVDVHVSVVRSTSISTGVERDVGRSRRSNTASGSGHRDRSVSDRNAERCCRQINIVDDDVRIGFVQREAESRIGIRQNHGVDGAGRRGSVDVDRVGSCITCIVLSDIDAALGIRQRDGNAAEQVIDHINADRSCPRSADRQRTVTRVASTANVQPAFE